MGFGRFLKKALIPGYSAVRTVDKMLDKGVVEGLKDSYKEDICEDMPLTSSMKKNY